MPQKIYLGSDHAAFEAKDSLIEWLNTLDYEVIDLGTKTPERCNYPDYARLVAREIQNDPHALGIILCGSGVGVSMVANRFQNVRAAVCHDDQQATLSREHNNANVLCLGARVTDKTAHRTITQAWLEAQFEGGRHAERVALFDDLGVKA